MKDFEFKANRQVPFSDPLQFHNPRGLINHALQSEKKGGQIYMCGALEELVNEGVQRGREEGRIEGIKANIRTCKTFKISKSDTIKNVVKEFALSEDEAKAYVEKYW